MSKRGSTRTYVWDVPTRVFHWCLVASFAAAWLTFDDNRFLYVHVYAGSTFFGLLIFRLLWGIAGTRYARFRAFAYDWPSVWAYLKGLATGQAARYLGHNPAGSWAIFLMLVLGVAVSLSGLVTLGGEERHGLLRGLFSFAAGAAAREVHEIAAWSMLGVAVIHVAGVIVESLFHHENLIGAMITGYKAGAGEGANQAYRLVGTLLALGIAGFGLYWFKGYLHETPDRPYVPFVGPQLPDNATWRQECGDCHMPYHPTLLPARSWRKLMADQADHFGDDLALDPETTQEITTFLVNNAAESELSEPAWRVNTTTPPTLTPLRTSDTPYWKNKHAQIPERVWKMEKVKEKGNCQACHLDALQGTFEDSGMRLPKSTN